MKLLVTLLLCISLCLSGCDKMDFPSLNSQSENAAVSQTEENNEVKRDENESISTPASQSETDKKENVSSTPLSEEEVMELGEQALAKWIQIGHSLNPPLYNTNLKEIGQEECRQIYSVYLYHNDLYESLVREESIAQNANQHWTEVKGIDEFSQNYFGSSFNSLEKNMTESKTNGDDIAFYFNARFSVLADDLVEYTLYNCMEAEDDTFTAEIHVKFHSPELEEYFGEPKVMLNFFTQGNNLCFSSASFEDKEK